MNKKYINHATVASYLSLVVEKMYNDGFDPDLVVGLSRGGLVPGIMLSLSLIHISEPARL